MNAIEQRPLYKNGHAVPCTKLLIVKSADEECEIDTESLRFRDVDVRFVEWQQLATITAIDGDIVLMDDSLRQDGLDLIRHIRAMAPACKIVVRLRHGGSEAVAYLQSGVSGILDSMHDANRLLAIIRQVCLGEYYLDRDIAQLLAMRQIKKWLEPFISLSSREFDVFCLLAEGCSLKTIAERLGINSKTVSNCQTAIKLKLALDSRQAIKTFAKYHGLIS